MGDDMVVRFRRKVVKRRGSRTYGYGSSKKHRGKGSKGGKGLAGSGKKGQQKKIMLMLKGYAIGKRGFKTPLSKYGKDITLTTREFLENISKMIEIYDSEVNEKDKFVKIKLDKNVRVVYQRSFEGLNRNYKGYDIEVDVHYITEKAKNYLEDVGIKVNKITGE